MKKCVNNLIHLARASIKANKLTGITVERVNDDALLDALELINKDIDFISFGVKNTGGILRKYINRLLSCNKYIWHTIDKMSDGGRAIDIDLINPVTGKVMTGSSSSTAINVLYGINDIGIGTDGGGSILAPALSLNLFSVMAKGMGLEASAENIKKSTDGIEFIPGIGVISHSYDMAVESVIDMLDLKDEYYKKYNNFKYLRIAIPKRENIILPHNADMTDKLKECTDLLTEMGIEVLKEKFPDFRTRKESIEIVNYLLDKYDILITYEGPVDFESIGDSVFGVMGDYAGEMQYKSGKYMVKIANILNATAVTIPSKEVSAGIVMIARKGVESGLALLNLGREIASLYRLPDLYYDYFKNSNIRRKNEFIFSKDRGV